MTEPATTQTESLSLIARAMGMITAPKATFQKIVATPKPFGILFLCAVVIGVATAVPQFTEAGQQAFVDMQLKINPDMTEQQVEGIRKFAPYLAWATIGGSIIFTPIMTLFMTALYWAAFNVVLGGTATYKQVLSVVSHASIIMALGLVVGIPFMMSSPTLAMGGPFNLGAMVPMLEEKSLIARLLSAISPFTIWSTLVNAIGLAVLYKRKTGGIFVALFLVYLAFAYVGTLFRG